MAENMELLDHGTVTSPAGFKAGAAYAGINKHARFQLDVGLLVADKPCLAAGVFTRNKVRAAPVVIDQGLLPSAGIRAIVVNSGCANASTGAQGLSDAQRTADLAAAKVGARREDILVASTGVIGQRLPVDLLEGALGLIRPSLPGGHDFARAILTTDTRPKEAACRSGEFTVGGAAKGSGMIHPDMATMLAFLTTDALVEPDFLNQALHDAVDKSFNMLSVDGDTSTNDSVFLLASGLAGGKQACAGSLEGEQFKKALEAVCVRLAREVARDGEGATRLIEMRVTGARTLAQARLAARTIISSSLVKTAVHGADPNWGRIIAAAGRSGADLEEDKLELELMGVLVLKMGKPVPFNKAALSGMLKAPEVAIRLNLHLGAAEAVAWGCDLSAEYVAINANYTT
jgi:glutamate N-acetyltransferase / amino-acid N-acetyltransferase